MNEYEVTETITTRVTLGDLNDLLVTAVEGGTGYWAEIRNYHFPESNQWNTQEVTVEFRNLDDKPNAWKPVKSTDLLRVLNKIRENSNQAKGWDVRMILDNQDADIADIAVQLLLLGEVTYG